MKLTAAFLLFLLPLAAQAGDPPLPDGLYAQITTRRGVVVCELEYARAPLTVTSFVGLAEGTFGPSPRKPFFDGLAFHRVVPGFVVQGGDPLGTGEGGPGYTFPDEFGSGLSHGSVGVLSMANSGPDTNGSQFFITLAPVDRLDFLYSVFGHTVRGEDVLPRIVQGDTMTVKILRLGPPAAAFKADDASFAALVSRTPKYGPESTPSPTAHFDDPDKLLPQDPPSSEIFLTKLNNVERATGVRAYARVFAKFSASPESPTPQAFTDRLATSLGLRENGALAVYFAASDEWCLSVGKKLETQFIGKAPFPEKASLASAVDELVSKSKIQAQKYAADSAAVLPNFLQDGHQRMKFRVGAFLTCFVSQLIGR